MNLICPSISSTRIAVMYVAVRIGQRRDLAHAGGASALARIISTLAIPHRSGSGGLSSCSGNAAYHLTIHVVVVGVQSLPDKTVKYRSQFVKFTVAKQRTFT